MPNRFRHGLFGVAIVVCAQQPIEQEIRATNSLYAPPVHAATLRADVNIVEVPVVVHDGNQSVAGLKREDFQVFDSGHPREITSFSVETPRGVSEPTVATKNAEGSSAPKSNPPADDAKRLIALLFDDLNTPFVDIQAAKKGAQKFVKESMVPGDRVAIATTAWQKSAPFITDRDELVKQIETVQPHSRTNDSLGMSQVCPPMNSYQAYLLANNLDNDLLNLKIKESESCSLSTTGDRRPPPGGRIGFGSTLALPVTLAAMQVWEEAKFNSRNTLRALESAVDAMAKLPGRKMIVLTSSGFLTGNLELELEDLGDRARRAGVVINTLEARGLVAYAPGGNASEPSKHQSGRTLVRTLATDAQMKPQEEAAPDDGLASLAYSTGGRFFQNSNDLAAGYRNLAAAPDVLYVLGISTSDVQDGKYHPLKVRLAKGLRGSVDARPGYTAQVPLSARHAEPVERPIDRAFVDGHTTSDAPIFVKAVALGGSSLKVAVTAHVDLAKLKLEERDGRRRQHLTFIAALLDPGGGYLAGKQGEIDLALTESNFRNLGATGIDITLDLEARPGKYVARGVVQESVTGKMTASNTSIEIR